jgi:diphthine-ammonia ligase
MQSVYFVFVQRRFPEVSAVSCGAILSNYQRFRVEDVCSRVGITPLHYLWQRDRRSLLDEMVAHGIYAVLVKVSGGGLDPRRHLGKDLAQMVPTFHRLHDRFGLDICGEGGEYETMVLDMPLFKYRIEISESEVVCDDNDPSVGHLRIKGFRVVPKQQQLEAHEGESVLVGGQGSTIWLDDLSHTEICRGMISAPVRTLPGADATAHSAPGCVSSAPTSVDGLGCTGIIMPQSAGALAWGDDGAQGALSKEAIIEKQVESLMLQLSQVLHTCDGVLADVCFMHLYVSDISNFGAVNSAYSKYFGRNPPSRSCIAVSVMYVAYYLTWSTLTTVSIYQALLPAGVEVALYATYLVGSYAAMGLGRSARREVRWAIT